MSSIRQVPWLRIFIEGVVIVGSILLAFGIDAWGEGQQERSEGARIVSALERDLVDTRTDLLNTVAAMEAVEDTIMLLLEHAAAGEPVLDQERLRVLAQQAFAIPAPEERLSTYEEVLSSGRLRLVQSDSLRLSLAILVNEVGDLRGWEEQLRQRWTSSELPYLENNAAIAHVFQGFFGVIFPEPVREDDNEFLTTFEFTNLISGRVVLIRIWLYNADILLERLDQTLELLRREAS
jgi:hypothetical protein